MFCIYLSLTFMYICGLKMTKQTRLDRGLKSVAKIIPIGVEENVCQT
jgi:hypothetical protein